MAAPCLPIELETSIIEHVISAQDLKACSLVRRSWREPSQRLLYATWRMPLPPAPTSPDPAQTHILRFDAIPTHLLASVRQILWERTEPVEQEQAHAFAVAQRCTNLRALDFNLRDKHLYRQGEAMPRLLRVAELFAAHAITRLHLRDALFMRCAELRDALLAFPALVDLALQDVTVHTLWDSYDVDDDPEQLPPCPRDLSALHLSYQSLLLLPRLVARSWLLGLRRLELALGVGDAQNGYWVDPAMLSLLPVLEDVRFLVRTRDRYASASGIGNWAILARNAITVTIETWDLNVLSHVLEVLIAPRLRVLKLQLSFHPHGPVWSKGDLSDRAALPALEHVELIARVYQRPHVALVEEAFAGWSRRRILASTIALCPLL